MLTRSSILQEMKGENPNIVLDPFFPECLGSDSYDLHLDNTLLVYKNTIPYGMKPAIPLDEDHDEEYFENMWKNPRSDGMRDWFETAQDYEDYCLRPQNYDSRNLKYTINPFKPKETIKIEIPETGLVLCPHAGYLGSTIEYTETHNLFPFIDGKSTIGRNFLLVHYTAGRGDRGFSGNWTLEINGVYPIIVKPGMRIGQIYYTESVGELLEEYGKSIISHYNGQQGPTSAKPLEMDNCIVDYLSKRKKTAVK